MIYTCLLTIVNFFVISLKSCILLDPGLILLGFLILGHIVVYLVYGLGGNMDKWLGPHSWVVCFVVRFHCYGAPKSREILMFVCRSIVLVVSGNSME